MPDRPLSPHAGVYKFKYTIVSSFLNRLTGIALTFGLIPLVYWLMALADGPEAYARAAVVLAHPIFKLIYVGLAFSLCYHLVAGIRHLIWDTGRGLEKRQSQQSAWIVAAVSVLLTALLVAELALHRGLL
ncbi:MAG: succinate dehydrogenase, cytochrome b556 subunit [Gammaproteobacteria bacterium]